MHAPHAARQKQKLNQEPHSVATANQILARESTAAKMLDMPLNEFRKLVAAGSLPRPVKIGGTLERWSVKQLEAISSGSIMSEEFEW